MRTIELDIASQSSVDAAVAQIIGEYDTLDVVMHNAGHMVYGPAEAFTTEQFADLYDTNALGAQRVPEFPDMHDVILLPRNTHNGLHAMPTLPHCRTV
jgi:NADP-dependent 3-hydroxy acid dehydrogenase YdfG